MSKAAIGCSAEKGVPVLDPHLPRKLVWLVVKSNNACVCKGVMCYCMYTLEHTDLPRSLVHCHGAWSNVSMYIFPAEMFEYTALWIALYETDCLHIPILGRVKGVCCVFDGA